METQSVTMNFMLYSDVQLSAAQHFCTGQYNAMSTGRKEDTSLFEHLDSIFIY